MVRSSQPRDMSEANSADLGLTEAGMHGTLQSLCALMKKLESPLEAMKHQVISPQQASIYSFTRCHILSSMDTEIRSPIYNINLAGTLLRKSLSSAS